MNRLPFVESENSALNILSTFHSILYGGNGSDIIIGDIGYAVRRYNASGSPIIKSRGDGWKKDIVLEEIGRITNIQRLSQKFVVGEIDAEAIAEASLLFVATAYNATGGKHIIPSSTGALPYEWPVDLFTFELEEEYNDKLYGEDGDDGEFVPLVLFIPFLGSYLTPILSAAVLIGQRGDDHLESGAGNDVLIGDAGSNHIAFNMDLPRIYQLYRSMESPAPYAPDAEDFGTAFLCDFELYPNPYRFMDSLMSIIGKHVCICSSLTLHKHLIVLGLLLITADQVVTTDDAMNDRNLVRDIIGVSGISTNDTFCMQPMFRVLPGFTTGRPLHGNDGKRSSFCGLLTFSFILF
jgi:Ca2+-binding RTX toxin-like protein